LPPEEETRHEGRKENADLLVAPALRHGAAVGRPVSFLAPL